PASWVAVEGTPRPALDGARRPWRTRPRSASWSLAPAAEDPGASLGRHFLLPHGHPLLDLVDQPLARLQGGGAVRRRAGHQHHLLTRHEPARAVDDGGVQERELGDGLRSHPLELTLGHLVERLVLQRRHHGAVVVAAHAPHVEGHAAGTVVRHLRHDAIQREIRCLEPRIPHWPSLPAGGFKGWPQRLGQPRTVKYGPAMGRQKPMGMFDWFRRKNKNAAPSAEQAQQAPPAQPAGTVTPVPPGPEEGPQPMQPVMESPAMEPEPAPAVES